MKKVMVIMILLIVGLFSKNIQDLSNISEEQAYKMIDRSGGINEAIKKMVSGSNKTIKNNNGKLMIDNTAFIEAYQLRGNTTQVVKIRIIKAQFVAKYSKNNKITESQAELFLKREDIKKEILQQMKMVNIKNYCPLTIFKVLFKKGLKMEFVYQYDGGELFGSYVISHQDCQKNNSSNDIQDLLKTIQTKKKKAIQKNGEQEYNSARAKSFMSDYPKKDLEIVSLYERACEKGSLKGCVAAGKMYYTAGYNIQHNYSKSASFYRKACEGGYPEGCKEIAFMYQYGFGLNQDKDKALKANMKACEGGLLEECLMIARIYEDEKNYEKAKSFYEKACEENIGKSCKQYMILDKKGY